MNYSDIKFQENGRLKLLIIVGTRPEIIRLAAVINKCREYFDCLLAHTGQNYDYNLNGIFFRDLKLKDPDVYMDAVGDDLGATMGNIINAGYKLMVQTRPDAVLVLGDTNSCLSVIGAKRLHIPIFHMEAGNRCFDECLPEETNRRIVDIISDVNLCYSEHARRYLNASGVAKERTYVTGSPMAEVLHENLSAIESSDIHHRLGFQKGRYILLSAHREENIDTEKNFLSLFKAVNAMAKKYDMPVLYSCHPRSRKRLEASGFELDSRVVQHEPLGFHDYNCLQMNAYAVVSDSGTLPEESSFFTSVGHPFPAICIRTSTERPEALDKGVFVLAGIDESSLLQAVDTAVAMNANGDYGIPARVIGIEYDPNRTANIALICYADGEKAYILAPQGLTDGMTVMSGAEAEVRVGNCLPLENIPVGTMVHNIELYAGKGGQLVRSAGMAAQLMAKEGKYATLRLPSGEMRMVPLNCRATVGVIGNGDHNLVKIGKAGRKRHMGIRPTVRGSVMNPNDHPHGGGEGRAPIGRSGPMTPWGKPALGLKTRKKNKSSNKMIVRRRDGKAIK